jgi:hypothetical protein
MIGSGKCASFSTHRYLLFRAPVLSDSIAASLWLTPRFVSSGAFFDRRSMGSFALPIQGKEGPGSSQADPLSLLRLQLGRRYGSNGME